MNPAQRAFCSVLRLYQWVVSPLLSSLFAPMGLGCRFTPTCSSYAFEAVQRHGAGKGSVLAVARVCRCHPWGGCGHDPVPDRTSSFPVRPGSSSNLSRTLSSHLHSVISR